MTNLFQDKSQISQNTFSLQKQAPHLKTTFLHHSVERMYCLVIDPHILRYLNYTNARLNDKLDASARFLHKLETSD